MAPPPARRRRPCAGYAFDVDASVRIPAHDPKRKERLCRYVLRPPIANDRVQARADGRFSLRLKRPWSDGTTHLVLDGPELVARLAALVPPPRVHTIRYHGVFAPRARLRPSIVKQRPDATCLVAHTSTDAGTPEGGDKRRRLGWAKLMARVFELDVLACPRCPGRLQTIAFITAPSAIRAILTSVGLATAPPARGRAVVQEEMDFA